VQGREKSALKCAGEFDKAILAANLKCAAHGSPALLTIDLSFSEMEFQHA
jgi:hypothetical protein